MSGARLPLPANVGAHGAYGFVRRTPADGGCGVGEHPCTHWGVDLVAVPGTRVVSPVTGWVVYSVGEIAPFMGFGPHIVVIEDETSDEHKFHLLAHLDYYQSRDYFGDHHANGWPVRTRQRVMAGEVVGVIGGYRHLHWQVQAQPYQSGGRRWADLTTDPLRWAQRRGAAYAPPSLLTGSGALIAFAFGLIATKGTL